MILSFVGPVILLLNVVDKITSTAPDYDLSHVNTGILYIMRDYEISLESRLPCSGILE